MWTLSESRVAVYTGVYRSFSNLDKMLDYQVPDLTGFNLKPYVSHQTPLAPKLDESGAPPAS